MTPTSPEAGQHSHTADLLRMTRESMNGSFTARFNAAGRRQPLLGSHAETPLQSRFASSKFWAAGG